VIFRIIAKERWPNTFWGDRVIARSGGILAIHLTDEFVSFEGTIALETISVPDLWLL
jgi:hypothetical protein